MKNLFEMNRLWVRMLHKNIKEAMQQEAKELDMLVGENIVRLSSLEGLTPDSYKSSLLPLLLSFTRSSKHPLSQQYLIDCIIKVFPDDYHLGTLEKLLEGCIALDKDVDVKLFLMELMERLGNCSEGVVGREAFEVFGKYVKWVIEEKGEKTVKLLELNARFMLFTVKLYPSEVGYVDSILESTETIIKKESEVEVDCLDLLMNLLVITLEALSLSVLELTHYSLLVKCLPFRLQTNLSQRILLVLINSNQTLTSLDKLGIFMELISSLTEPKSKLEINLQLSIAKLIHFICIEEPEKELLAIAKFKQEFSKDPNKFILTVFPGLVWALYKLSAKCKDSTLYLKAHEFAFQIIGELALVNPEAAIKLLLNGALVLNEHGFELNEAEALFMQYVDKAISLFHDELIDSNVKYRVLILIIGTVERANSLSDTFFEQLTKKVVGSCTRLLRKQDQCKAILWCSHIFATPSRVIKK
eukprot:TRINITY_DN12376_c0_g2_i3.p1 TRINITY_DN12376_c0_g2~~TRINITY_DN12376_c0_g2_i3.p1  ORF type:complete len:472 (-),score=68.71 TRINITY_DN12376_c0_g2_i3:96-1511(-)